MFLKLRYLAIAGLSFSLLDLQRENKVSEEFPAMSSA